MNRKNVTVRLKINVIEKLKLMAKQENKSFQKIFDEVLELGYIEKNKGGIKYG